VLDPREAGRQIHALLHRPNSIRARAGAEYLAQVIRCFVTPKGAA